MNKNLKKKNFNTPTLITIIAVIFVTVFGIMYTWISCGKPWTITSYKDIKQVTYENYKTKSTDEYYVFVYDTDEAVSSLYETKVSEYANYARLHSTTKLYAYNYIIDNNIKIVNDLDLDEDDQVTRLILIKNNAVSTSYTDWDDILNKLEEGMK